MAKEHRIPRFLILFWLLMAVLLLCGIALLIYGSLHNEPYIPFWLPKPVLAWGLMHG